MVTCVETYESRVMWRLVDERSHHWMITHVLGYVNDRGPLVETLLSCCVCWCKQHVKWMRVWLRQYYVVAVNVSEINKCVWHQIKLCKINWQMKGMHALSEKRCQHFCQVQKMMSAPSKPSNALCFGKEWVCKMCAGESCESMWTKVWSVQCSFRSTELCGHKSEACDSQS